MIYVREYSWMWDKLGLSLAECRVYAYIYGLTHGEKGGYDGSKRHLAELLGIGESSVRNALDKLKEQGLISWNNMWFCTSASDDNDTAQPMRESAQPMRESAHSPRSPHTPLYNNYNINKKDSVSRKSANTHDDLDLLKKLFYQIDMETLDSVIKRQSSLQVIWELLNPAPEYRGFYNDFMRYWNRIDRDRQLQIWYFLKRKIDNKQPLDPNPLEVLKNCHPYPINYNGTSAYNTMLKSPVKMVKACYNGHFGAYEQMDARLYHMTHIEPLNY